MAAVLSLALQCRLSEPWALERRSDDRCVDQYAMRSGLGAIYILTDLDVIAFSYAIMYGVQVNWQKRWTLVGLFAFRILSIDLFPNVKNCVTDIDLVRQSSLSAS